MLEDLSTDVFISGLHCFIAIKLSVTKVGAKTELNAALQEVDAERMATFLVEKLYDFVLSTHH